MERAQILFVSQMRFSLHFWPTSKAAGWQIFFSSFLHGLHFLAPTTQFPACTSFSVHSFSFSSHSVEAAAKLSSHFFNSFFLSSADKSHGSNCGSVGGGGGGDSDGGGGGGEDSSSSCCLDDTTAAFSAAAVAAAARDCRCVKRWLCISG